MAIFFLITAEAGLQVTKQTVKAILGKIFMEMYGQMRKFLWWLETKFVKILLLLENVECMMGSVCAIFANNACESLNFDDDAIDEKCYSDEMW